MSDNTSPEHIAAVLKRSAALDLRRNGWSLQRIADHLGYASRSGAYKAITTALDETLREPADALRELELQRCDELQSSWWYEATHGNERAAVVVLRVMDRRARILGLDLPQMEDFEPWLREQALREGLDPDQAVADAQRLIRDARLDRGR